MNDKLERTRMKIEKATSITFNCKRPRYGDVAYVQRRMLPSSFCCLSMASKQVFANDVDAHGDGNGNANSAVCKVSDGLALRKADAPSDLSEALWFAPQKSSSSSSASACVNTASWLMDDDEQASFVDLMTDTIGISNSISTYNGNGTENSNSDSESNSNNIVDCYQKAKRKRKIKDVDNNTKTAFPVPFPAPALPPSPLSTSTKHAKHSNHTSLTGLVHNPLTPQETSSEKLNDGMLASTITKTTTDQKRKEVKTTSTKKATTRIKPPQAFSPTCNRNFPETTADVEPTANDTRTMSDNWQRVIAKQSVPHAWSRSLPPPSPATVEKTAPGFVYCYLIVDPQRQIVTCPAQLWQLHMSTLHDEAQTLTPTVADYVQNEAFELSGFDVSTLQDFTAQVSKDCSPGSVQVYPAYVDQSTPIVEDTSPPLSSNKDIEAMMYCHATQVLPDEAPSSISPLEGQDSSILLTTDIPRNTSCPCTEACDGKPPVRSLSAYNYFFRDERTRLLAAAASQQSTTAVMSCDFAESLISTQPLQSAVHQNKQLQHPQLSPRTLTAEHQTTLLANHWNRDRSVKRPHRKSAGKIPFAELSKRISSEWKRLDASTKDFYKRTAGADWQRYLTQLRHYQLHHCDEILGDNATMIV